MLKSRQRGRMTWSATLQLVVWSLGVAACVSPTSPIATCTSGQTTRLTLTVGAYTSIDPSSDAGCVTIAANASMTDSAEYLVIAQSAGGTRGDSAAFQLGSSALTAAVVAQVVPPETQSSVAAQFDHFLREAARTGRYPATPNSLVALPEPNVSASTGPAVAPPVGDARTFKVCANLTCSSLVNVGAIARAVVGHIAIYVDTLAPKNGLDSAEVDTLAQLFEHHVYEVDTTAFGNELDTDNNSVVIALMSPTVNQLAPSPCTNGFVSGFFFSADLDPRFAASYNHARRGDLYHRRRSLGHGQLCPHRGVCETDAARHVPSRGATSDQLHPACAGAAWQGGRRLAGRGALQVRGRARGPQLSPRDADRHRDVQQLRLRGPPRRLPISAGDGKPLHAHYDRPEPPRCRRGVAVRALRGRSVRGNDHTHARPNIPHGND